jgi:thymidylate synthase
MALPRVEIAQKPLGQLSFEDIELIDYQHHPFIRFKVAV